MLITVVCLNSLLAAGVCYLAYGLWQWRSRLIECNSWLQSTSAAAGVKPQKVGYGLTLRRAQMAQVRLGLARWQLRSQQLRQLISLLRLVRTVLRYRARRR